MERPSEQKSERIDIRTSPSAKRLLQQAASSKHKNVSEFLLEHGLAAAKETLADRRLFLLDDKQWQAFRTVLDRAPMDKSRLKKLLSEPGVFD